MAESNTPRFGLRVWGAPTDSPSRTEFNDSFAAIESKAAIYITGTRAARPNAGTVGRTYTVVGDATTANNGTQFYDTGSTWVELSKNSINQNVQSDSTGTVSATVRALAGQTSLLSQWINSGGSVVASVDPSGKGTFSTFQAGSTALTSTLAVSGATTLSSLSVSGTASLTSLSTVGAANIGGQLTANSAVVNSNATISGNLTVNGTINGVNVVVPGGPSGGSFSTLSVSGGSSVAALTASGLITANGGLVTNYAQVNGSIEGDFRSTSLRTDGTPKTQLLRTGVARVDGLIPPGSIIAIAMSTVPTGWLRCDGASYSTASYPDLFAAIGNNYGGVAGSGAFNVPDSRDRVMMGDGLKPMYSLGGQDTFTLTTGHLPPHTHATNHNHPAVTTTAAGAHQHNTAHNEILGASSAVFRSGSSGNPYITDDNLSSSAPAHSHTVAIDPFLGTSGIAGSGAAHSIVQSYFTARYIIKT